MAHPMNSFLPPKSFQGALDHYQAGRMAQAEAICRQILQIEPNQPDALNLLGTIAGRLGKSEIAIELIGKAISANPSNPVYYINLGNVLKEQGKLDEAIENYRKALSLNPDLAGACFNLGIALHAQGKLD